VEPVLIAVYTSGIVRTPTGYAVYASPDAGIILYRTFRGTYRPRIALTSCLVNAAFTVVVLAIGIVVEGVKLILAPGGDPVPSPDPGFVPAF